MKNAMLLKGDYPALAKEHDKYSDIKLESCLTSITDRLKEKTKGQLAVDKPRTQIVLTGEEKSDLEKLEPCFNSHKKIKKDSKHGYTQGSLTGAVLVDFMIQSIFMLEIEHASKNPRQSLKFIYVSDEGKPCGFAISSYITSTGKHCFAIAMTENIDQLDDSKTATLLCNLDNQLNVNYSPVSLTTSTNIKSAITAGVKSGFVRDWLISGLLNTDGSVNHASIDKLDESFAASQNKNHDGYGARISSGKLKELINEPLINKLKVNKTSGLKWSVGLIVLAVVLFYAVALAVIAIQTAAVSVTIAAITITTPYLVAGVLVAGVLLIGSIAWKSYQQDKAVDSCQKQIDNLQGHALPPFQSDNLGFNSEITRQPHVSEVAVHSQVEGDMNEPVLMNEPDPSNDGPSPGGGGPS